MSAQTFTWHPLENSRAQARFRIRKAQFGDGYAQRASDGLNPLAKPWDLRFRGRAGAIAPIRAFLDAHAGVTAFLWTPPGGAEGLYVCEEYDEVALVNDRFEIRATFLEAPSP